MNNPLKYIDPTGETFVVNGDDADFIVDELKRLTGYELKRCAAVDAKAGCKQKGQVIIDTSVKRKTGKGISNNLAKILEKVIAPTAKVDGKDKEFTVTLNTTKNGDYFFDSFQKSEIDVGDYKASIDVKDADGKGDNGAFVATQLGHVLEEYFQAETTFKDLEQFGRGENSSLFKLSHATAKEVEGSVLSDFTGSTEGGRIEAGQGSIALYTYKTVRYSLIFESPERKSIQQIFRRPVPK